MTNKHTQGEWFANDGQIYTTETGRTIAIISYFDKKNETDVANQKLIAAAPQMLEALIKINGLMADCTDGKINVGQIAKISIEAINAATN